MSLESIPTWFSDFSEISLEAAQVLLSMVVILAVLIPIMYLSRNNKGNLPTILMFFLTEAFLVGIGWMPFWILIATVAVMAIAVAYLGTSVVTGG